jgi:transketolase
MALDIAPALYVLFKNHLVANPEHPEWLNRDRFVLSSGHNSRFALCDASSGWLWQSFAR